MNQKMKKVVALMLVMALMIGTALTKQRGVAQAAELSNETMEGATLLELV